MYRMLIAAALLGTLCVGLAGSAVGRGAFQYREHDLEADGNNIVWNNATVVVANNLESAYEVIEKELGIPALRLNYIPTDMVFAGLEIVDNRAVIEFDYQGYTVRLVEIDEEEDAMSVHVSDREEYGHFQSKLLKEEIILDKNCLDGTKTEYGARLSTKEAYYYFSGIMEEKEFNQILQMMYFE